MTPVAAFATMTSSRPASSSSAGHPLRIADVPAQEHRLRAERLELPGRLRGRPVGAQVADRDPARAELGEAERDRLADPREPASDEDGLALEPGQLGLSGLRRAPGRGS